jgi:hypothetical protein
MRCGGIGASARPMTGNARRIRSRSRDVAKRLQCATQRGKPSLAMSDVLATMTATAAGKALAGAVTHARDSRARSLALLLRCP